LTRITCKSEAEARFCSTFRQERGGNAQTYDNEREGNQKLSSQRSSPLAAAACESVRHNVISLGKVPRPLIMVAH
jgi:hypothetical protein